MVSERERLEEQRAEARQRLASLKGDFAAVVAASEGSNADDEHDPEGSTIAFERQQVVALIRQTEDHLAEIDAALERVAAGGYGTCEVCGRPIPAARLDALPTARRCVDCASTRRRVTPRR